MGSSAAMLGEFKSEPRVAEATTLVDFEIKKEIANKIRALKVKIGMDSEVKEKQVITLDKMYEELQFCSKYLTHELKEPLSQEELVTLDNYKLALMNGFQEFLKNRYKNIIIENPAPNKEPTEKFTWSLANCTKILGTLVPDNVLNGFAIMTGMSIFILEYFHYFIPYQVFVELLLVEIVFGIAMVGKFALAAWKIDIESPVSELVKTKENQLKAINQINSLLIEQPSLQDSISSKEFQAYVKIACLMNDKIKDTNLEIQTESGNRKIFRYVMTALHVLAHAAKQFPTISTILLTMKVISVAVAPFSPIGIGILIFLAWWSAAELIKKGEGIKQIFMANINKNNQVKSELDAFQNKGQELAIIQSRKQASKFVYSGAERCRPIAKEIKKHWKTHRTMVPTSIWKRKLYKPLLVSKPRPQHSP